MQKNGNPLSYKIIGDLEVSISITGNPYGLPPGRLFQMAARMNKKRSFLFVSKVLGKHIPVGPHVPLLAGAALGLLYRESLGEPLPVRMEELLHALDDPEAAERVYGALKRSKLRLKEKTLFIGFAETATALGHSVFDMFEGEAAFLHTTRESIGSMSSCIDFEEEHSHATAHRCYAEDPSIFEGAETIVLVDDEMTTGKTAINIIRDLHAKYGRKNYVLASLLDWRSKEDVGRLSDTERDLGVRIGCLSLMSGEIAVTGAPVESAPETEKPAAPLTEPVIDRIEAYGCFSVLASSELNTSYLRDTGRFGLTAEGSERLERELERTAEWLKGKRSGSNTLCMGAGEFMYIPMRIAALLGDGVKYQSSTRSPIHPYSAPHYAVHSAYRFASPEHEGVMNFMYNIPHGRYDELFLFMERQMPEERMAELRTALRTLGIPRIHLVSFSKTIAKPDPIGSYKREDAEFLLKDLSGVSLERKTEEREASMQSGGHYSESLPIEYEPTPEYIRLFQASLEQSSGILAQAAGTVSELLLRKHGPNIVLASLARGGTPAGVLIRRYLKQVHRIEVPHYSLSIIRGKGIDENALLYIHRLHPERTVQFVDGWTGKGAIRKVLGEACAEMNRKYGLKLNDELAVLADSGRCADAFGTREDFLIPSACLNSTVSGLISRTVLRSDLIGEEDFHGAKYYRQYSESDLTARFVDTISSRFEEVREEAQSAAEKLWASPESMRPTWQGLEDIRAIQDEFGVAETNFIKPGVGETTRVLLRRVPRLILVDRMDNPHLKHILLLAEERGVPVEIYPHMSYSCCGIIKAVKGDQE